MLHSSCSANSSTSCQQCIVLTAASCSRPCTSWQLPPAALGCWAYCQDVTHAGNDELGRLPASAAAAAPGCWLPRPPGREISASGAPNSHLEHHLIPSWFCAGSMPCSPSTHLQGSAPVRTPAASQGGCVLPASFPVTSSAYVATLICAACSSWQGCWMRRPVLQRGCSLVWLLRQACRRCEPVLWNRMPLSSCGPTYSWGSACKHCACQVCLHILEYTGPCLESHCMGVCLSPAVPLAAGQSMLD